MTFTMRLALPLTLLAVGAVSLTAAAPASAGGSVLCSYSRTTTAQITSVSLPDPVEAGSRVSGRLTIDRSAGNTGPVEVKLLPSSWTRTNLCVIVPAGESSATFDVAISPVTTEGNDATVGAYATPDGADLHRATSLIVLR